MTTLYDIINTSAPPRQPIRCADGFRISAQASAAHYCLDSLGNRPTMRRPRGTLSPWIADAVTPFTAVECGFPSERPEPWDAWKEYAENADEPTATVYGYVPVDLVRALIESHGGEK